MLETTEVKLPMVDEVSETKGNALEVTQIQETKEERANRLKKERNRRYYLKHKSKHNFSIPEQLNKTAERLNQTTELLNKTGESPNKTPKSLNESLNKTAESGNKSSEIDNKSFNKSNKYIKSENKSNKSSETYNKPLETESKPDSKHKTRISDVLIPIVLVLIFIIVLYALLFSKTKFPQSQQVSIFKEDQFQGSIFR
ncbi:MAG: hypothetical protein QXJ62_05000 [Nitrososphaeria archaeon]